MRIELFGLELPEVCPNDDLAGMIVNAAGKEAGGIRNGDILVVTSKIISKAYNLLIAIEKLDPKKEALRIAKKTGMEPRMVQAVLDNSEEILFVIPYRKLVERGLIDIAAVSKDPRRANEVMEKIPCIIYVRRNKQFYSDAGLDFSNHPEGVVSVPPLDPDGYAKKLRKMITEATGKEVALVISDTEGDIDLPESLDVARGSSGIEVLARSFGEMDRFNKPKFAGIDNIPNELACASALLMGQTSEGIPAVLVRGLKYNKSEKGISDYSRTSTEYRMIFNEIMRETARVVGVRRGFNLLFGRMPKE
jgi:coenzyme F420-0:L-glutamate ligase/coenzyme F420-1:gamma-L-glutamate ligase